MVHNRDDIQSIVNLEDANKYPYNEGLVYPYLFKLLIKYPRFINKVFRSISGFFVKLGQIGFKVYGKTVPSQVFLFFPWNIIGGADMVNIEITLSLKNYFPVVFFTDRIDKSLIRNNYPEQIVKINLTEKYIKYLHWFQQFFWVGYISEMINTTISKEREKVLLLGSNCVLFYEILKYIHQDCQKVDVIHAWIGIERHSLPLVPNLTRRIIITPTLYPNLEKQYNQYHLTQYLDRISVILNGVNIPNSIKDKPNNKILKIIYVGRESPEKRTHIIGKIATESKLQNIPAEFHLIGVSSNAVNIKDLEFCNIIGEITNKEVLQSIYHSSDIILITSSFEGFPMVIMEGMAYGVIPISTDVGGVKDHISNDETGYCVNNSTEEQIVQDIIAIIKDLVQNRQKLRLIQINAYNYALMNFSADTFQKKYKSLVNNLLST